ncbi:hypothetical protein [Brachybacterium kimchii]|uniref:SRPBCC family protein n=1 Tax=Brachybacterium kimchii TaxID=2942909 RepID=A0ABY4N4P2_9MICO|nr:hypothetical protein [Brachybacterium kimchii]UQN29541.1 hypothetical protein M4486_18205 [Brachybacterium kimchii]
MGTAAWRVRCAPERAVELVDAPLRAAGWREVERDGEEPKGDTRGGGSRGPVGVSQVFERGRLGRSVLMGGLAGGGQHLEMRVDVRPSDDGASGAAPTAAGAAPARSEVRCSWSDASPRALGGILGERRARRTMDSTTRSLRVALEDAGVLIASAH